MQSQVEKEIMNKMEVVKAKRDQALKAFEPASKFIRALSNVSDYFRARDYDKCMEILDEVVNA